MVLFGLVAGVVAGVAAVLVAAVPFADVIVAVVPVADMLVAVGNSDRSITVDLVAGTAGSPAVGAFEDTTPDTWLVGMGLAVPQDKAQFLADVVAVGLAEVLVLGPPFGLDAPAAVPPPKPPVSG